MIKTFRSPIQHHPAKSNTNVSNIHSIAQSQRPRHDHDPTTQRHRYLVLVAGADDVLNAGGALGRQSLLAHLSRRVSIRQSIE
jgi:hypothetical protein